MNLLDWLVSDTILLAYSIVELANEGGGIIENIEINAERGYFALSHAEREVLARWIDFAIEPSGGGRKVETDRQVNSYKLRQDFELAAFRVTDKVIRCAMEQAGYTPTNANRNCWGYHAKYRLPRRDTEWWYAFTPEDKARWRTFQQALDELFELQLP